MVAKSTGKYMILFGGLSLRTGFESDSTYSIQYLDGQRYHVVEDGIQVHGEVNAEHPAGELVLIALSAQVHDILMHA